MGIGSPARTMAINGAMLYGAGAALVLVFLLLPHPTETSRPVILAAGGLAGSVTVLLVLGRNWLPAWPFPALTATGTVLITALVVADGSRPSFFMMLYIWAVVYAFYFYSLPVATVESVLVAAGSGVALALTHDHAFPIFGWVMIVATSVMAGLAVRQLVVQVGHLADQDAGTGVLSRRRYHVEVDRELARARRSGQPLSLVVLDLDNFKRLNDAHGHVYGDLHLRSTAQVWSRMLRATDLLARYGGEEFVVLLPGTPIEEAARLADRLRAAVPNDQTASAGVAQWDGRESPTELFGRADSALYAAKAAGRDTTVAAVPGAAPVAPVQEAHAGPSPKFVPVAAISGTEPRN